MRSGPLGAWGKDLLDFTKRHKEKLLFSTPGHGMLGYDMGPTPENTLLSQEDMLEHDANSCGMAEQRDGKHVGFCWCL